MDTLEHLGLKIKIIRDEHASSPRREFDHFGTMVCFHRRYDLGDKHKFRDAEHLQEYCKETRAIVLPLFLYDHSGLSISASAFSCRWDSGQIGYIFIEREKILKEYSVKKITKSLRDKVIKNLEAEVSEYDQYLTGEVYGFVIETQGGTELDSCWGFYGMEYCIQEAKDSAEYFAKQEKESLCRTVWNGGSVMRYEYTDTFGGESNYSWAHRGEVDAENLKQGLRRAKKALGLSGMRGRVTMNSGDTIAWRPYRCATILFISWGDSL